MKLFDITSIHNTLDERPQEFENLAQRNKFACGFVNDDDIADKTMLNIGCGFGNFELYALRKKCKLITAIDVTDDNMSMLKMSIQDKRVNFLVGNAISLNFADNSFDTVVAFDVIEHIPLNTETIMFKEIKRVLKNNGVMYLTTPYDSFFSKLLDPAYIFGHRHYSKNQLLEYAHNVKFTVENMLLIGGWWEALSVFDLYFSKWVLRKKNALEKYYSKKLEAECNEIKRKNNGFMGIAIKCRNSKL